MKKIYLIGEKESPEARGKFKEAEENLTAAGNTVINPMKIIDALPVGISNSEFIVVATELIRISDAVFFIEGYEHDLIASLERANAQRLEKEILV